MRSYVVEYNPANPAHTMIGGVKKSRSSRWETREDALEFAARVRDVHQRLEQPIEIITEIKTVRTAPEIFRHCPDSIPQALHGHCFRCRRVLTEKDANIAGRREEARARRKK